MILGWGAFVFPISNLITYIMVRNRIQNSIPSTGDINDGTFNGKPDNSSPDTHLGQHVPWLDSLDSKGMHPKLSDEKSNKWAKHFVLEGKKSKTVRRGLAVADARDVANESIGLALPLPSGFNITCLRKDTSVRATILLQDSKLNLSPCSSEKY